MTEDREEDTARVIICQGPPRCPLEGDDAVAAQKDGCPWCERHILQPNGEWHVEKPGPA